MKDNDIPDFGHDDMGGAPDVPDDMGGAPDGGPDDIGGPDDMGGAPDVPDDMGGAPDGGPDDGPDDIDEPDTENGGSEEDDEMLEIFNGLSLDDKVAVLKYARSLGDSDEEHKGSEHEDMGNFNESVRRKKDSIINEIMNDIFNRRDGEKTTKREPREIENDKITKRNPFVGNR